MEQQSPATSDDVETLTDVLTGSSWPDSVAEKCEVQYERHPTQPHLIAVCARPKGHDGEHSNVLRKPGADPDRERTTDV